MTVSQDLHYGLAKIKNRIAPGFKLRDEKWTIQIWRGPSPFALAPPARGEASAMSAEQVDDLAADFVADPFLIRHDGRWLLFFEALEAESRQGVICYAWSADCEDWHYGGVVLREAFHLSYPYVFKHDETFYMVPESAQAGRVTLYRADDFPTRWSPVTELRQGAYRDPSIVHCNGLWWLFCQSGKTSDSALHLHYAAELEGPWREHPKSPLITGDPHITRPGGRLLQFDGRLFRIAQDTYPEYGLQLFAFEILQLDTDSYSERLVGDGPILKGKGKGLFRERIHHLDAHQIAPGQWIAAVDHSRRTLAPRLA